jgi:hypothetical protein
MQLRSPRTVYHVIRARAKWKHSQSGFPVLAQRMSRWRNRLSQDTSAPRPTAGFGGFFWAWTSFPRGRMWAVPSGGHYLAHLGNPSPRSSTVLLVAGRQCVSDGFGRGAGSQRAFRQFTSCRFSALSTRPPECPYFGQRLRLTPAAAAVRGVGSGFHNGGIGGDVEGHHEIWAIGHNRAGASSQSWANVVWTHSGTHRLLAGTNKYRSRSAPFPLQPVRSRKKNAAEHLPVWHRCTMTPRMRLGHVDGQINNHSQELIEMRNS